MDAALGEIGTWLARRSGFQQSWRKHLGPWHLRCRIPRLYPNQLTSLYFLQRDQEALGWETCLPEIRRLDTSMSRGELPQQRAAFALRRPPLPMRATFSGSADYQAARRCHQLTRGERTTTCRQERRVDCLGPAVMFAYSCCNSATSSRFLLSRAQACEKPMVPLTAGHYLRVREAFADAVRGVMSERGRR